MFPADDILIARGKYSTLNKERHEQIKRVQEICRTIQGTVPMILDDSQEKPPVGKQHLELLGKCVENLSSAHERLITLSLGLNELEEEAWQ